MEQNLGWLLARAAFNWRNTVDHYMEDIGLTQSRWIALLHLGRMGEGCSQSELAADIGIEQPSLVRTLQHLEDAQLIERRACAEDARRRTLWLTAKGRQMLGDVESMARKGRQKLLSGLNREQRQVLHECLNQIIENANHLPQADKK
ncbi:MAG: transcriptional regulator SlyA [Oceanospirillaceae bacterium]|nr:transcriptional regulator SlyA [Oceanospirillaceae bacterium]MBT13809.1 transcriptional regulator SlyA [Oceanospirillaceae bacterium]|tara:strand:- start:13834 stop:14274 length:441 start_codon:yes stop_codon:yes gene_type:complete